MAGLENDHYGMFGIRRRVSPYSSHLGTERVSRYLHQVHRCHGRNIEQHHKSESFVNATNQINSSFKTLVKNLGEAKFEHYALGTEKEHKISERLVKCHEKLMQSIGGLRSAAETQFALLAQWDGHGSLSETALNDTINSSVFSEHTGSQSSPQLLSPSLSHVERRSSILASIDELPENSAEVSAFNSANGSDDESSQGNGNSIKKSNPMQTSLTPADMFSVFIAHLGPPMVNHVLACTQQYADSIRNP
jgi:hypothetical protein